METRDEDFKVILSEQLTSKDNIIINNIDLKIKKSDDGVHITDIHQDKKVNSLMNIKDIQSNLSDSVENVSQININKIKENTLDGNKTFPLNTSNHNSLENVSILSQTTLKPEFSDLSQNDDFHSINESNSVVKLEDKKVENCHKVLSLIEYSEQPKPADRKEEVENIFSAGIINVVLAQVNNVAVLDYNKKANTIKSRENIVFGDSLTSAESFLSESDTVTFSSSNDNSTNINLKESSSATLKPGVNEVNCLNDNFVIAKTSSYFKENSSDQTLIIRGSANDLSKITKNDLKNFNNQDQKPALLDTIINMKMFPDVPKSDLFQDNVESLNDVVITNDNFKMPTLNMLDNISKNATCDIFSKSAFRKPLSAEDDGDRLNRIRLPSENTIIEMIKGTEKSQKISCSDESNNYTPVEDLWSKLTTYLDITIRRLEESLLERIDNEFKKVLTAFEKFNTHIEDTNTSKSGISMKIVEPDIHDEGLQCCLIHNNVIDELASNLNNKCNPKRNKSYEANVPEVNPKIEHKLDIIKPPVPRLSNDTALGYSAIASSSEGLKVRLSSKNQCVVRLILRPVRFFKENMVVIVSVPLFCFVLFLIYTFLVLVKTFW